MHTSGNGHFKVGQSMQVEAMVDLGELAPTDVQVQLYAGPITASGAMSRMLRSDSTTRSIAPRASR